MNAGKVQVLCGGRHGSSHAVHLAAEFRFDGLEVIATRDDAAGLALRFGATSST